MYGFKDLGIHTHYHRAIIAYGAGFIVDRLKLSQRVSVADADMFDAEGWRSISG
jgi:hypothetical protein